jgi:hypothetical protein
MDMRRGSFASLLGVMLVAKLGTFCSLAETDIEGTPPLSLQSSRRTQNPRDDGDDASTKPPSSSPTTDAGSQTTTDAGSQSDGSAGGGGNGGPRIAFVTSLLTTGNFGGVAGADAICTKLANDAKIGSGGPWRAFISTSTTNAIDRMTANGPWKTTAGKIVATMKTDLASGTLKAPLDKDEKAGTPPIENDQVWTATGKNGAYLAEDCQGWTATTGNGLVGEAERSDERWTARASVSCTEGKRLFCFEQ